MMCHFWLSCVISLFIRLLEYSIIIHANIANIAFIISIPIVLSIRQILISWQVIIKILPSRLILSHHWTRFASHLRTRHHYLFVYISLISCNRLVDDASLIMLLLIIVFKGCIVESSRSSGCLLVLLELIIDHFRLHLRRLYCKRWPLIPIIWKSTFSHLRSIFIFITLTSSDLDNFANWLNFW